jgi:hypothetical protein
VLGVRCGLTLNITHSHAGNHGVRTYEMWEEKNILIKCFLYDRSLYFSSKELLQNNKGEWV